MLKELLTRTHGQDLAEYALLLGLIAVVVMIAVAAFGLSLDGMFVTLAKTCSEVVAMIAPEPEPEPEPEPVPECYGSLLLPIMVAVAGMAAALSRWQPNQPALAFVNRLPELPQIRKRMAGHAGDRADSAET
jgi:Flp pilus assembly pilin Flp